jgi:hypothetical protein
VGYRIVKAPVLYIRPPASLKEKLMEAAKENRRTLNQEVIRRLELSFDGWKLDRVRP